MNGAFRDIAKDARWLDPDRYGLRLSAEISRSLEAGLEVSAAVDRAIEVLDTDFFRTNRGAKAQLPTALVESLKKRRLNGGGLIDVLRRFKQFAERQLVSDLVKTKREDVCRSHLQTYLESLGRTSREVGSGAGRSDILLLLPDTEEIIEAKVWKGQQYHEDGLAELSSYIRTEGLRAGYYVVFEFHKVDPNTPDGDEFTDQGVRIKVIFVHIPLTAPSKIEKARRSHSR